jgi:hypothetical protein
MRDKKRILEGRPRIFEGSLFIIEDFDGTSSPSLFKFDKVGFWIRMVDLPLVCMNQATGRRIGSTVGLVEVVDTEKDGIGWGEYLRVKGSGGLVQTFSTGENAQITGKIELDFISIPKPSKILFSLWCYSPQTN